MNKNIVIIEDTFGHLQIIRELIKGNNINTFPSTEKINDEQKLTKFLTPVNHMLGADNETRRNLYKDKFIKNISGAQPIFAYIIDFQIFIDKDAYNGIKFCEYIPEIRNGDTPVILLTKYPDNHINITHLRTRLLDQFPGIRIEIVRKLQNDGSNWDEEIDVNDNLNVDKIVRNSSFTKETILSYLNLFNNGLDSIVNNSSD